MLYVASHPFENGDGRLGDGGYTQIKEFTPSGAKLFLLELTPLALVAYRHRSPAGT